MEYVLAVLAQSYEVEITFTDAMDDGSTVVSNADGDVVAEPRNITGAAHLNFDKDFTSDGFLKLDNNAPDHLSTAFYLLSLAQELDGSKKDRYGRFPYSESYQKHFNAVAINRVQHCFDAVVRSTPKLGFLKRPFSRSRVFVSHDVDFINGALMQDGFFALKHMNIPALFQIMFSNLLVNPQWLNMDRIMKIESEHDFRSTFYWLVNRGLSKEGIKNADYDFRSKKVQEHVKLVASNGWENGLHKSISDDSFMTEMGKLTFIPVGNRYHFLKFRPHTDFQLIHDAGLKFDSSLGFAEEVGFRNNYGLPYRPFDLKTRAAFDFVECPLHIMDTTLHGYQKLSANDAFAKIIAFVEANSAHAILSLLWHNNYFTPYKFGEYLDLYKRILLYFNERDLQCITQSQMIEKYS